RIDVVGAILEEKFGRRIARERGIERQDTKIGRRFDCRPPDQGLYSCGCGVRGLCRFGFAHSLLDAAYPIDAFSIGGIEDGSLLKTFDREFQFIQLKASLAKMIADLAVLRPFV